MTGSKVLKDVEFLTRADFLRSVKDGNTKFSSETIEYIEKASERDIVFIDITVASPAKFGDVGIVKDGDIISWMKQRWATAGITQMDLNKIFGDFSKIE